MIANRNKTGKRKSIVTKINVGVMAVLIPTLIIFVLVSCLIAATTVSSLTEKVVNSQTENAVATIDSFFQEKISAASMFEHNAQMQTLLMETPTMETLQTSDKKDAVVTILKNVYDTMTAEGVQAVWIAGKANDAYLMYSGEISAANLANESWPKRVDSEKKVVVSEAFLDPVSGNMVISIAAPIFEPGGNIIGYTGFDVYQDNLNELLSGIKIGETGSMDVLSNDFNYIFSFDESVINKNVDDIDIESGYVEKVKQDFIGDYDYSYGGEAYNAVFANCETTEWQVVSSIPLKEVNATRNQLVIILTILSIVILALLILTILILVRKTVGPLKHLTKDVEQFAQGDLNVSISVATNDEIGLLAQSVKDTIATLKDIIQNVSFVLAELSKGNLDLTVQGNYIGDFQPMKVALTQIVESLNATLGQINQSADQVSGGADQVSNGAQALSQGATEQASSIEELAATINEISETIQDNATNAKEASAMANHVGSEMNESNEQMQQMIKAMNDISNSSSEIGKIIKTIEDIAFQTNILALNAAVEAARAGAAGKGFAVVADEVRNLASKSAEASKNTATLIETSIQAVDNGTRIADETAKTLVQAVEGAENVTTIIDKIAEASDAQANSVAQVTQGIDQISSVVQTNSATAEESAAASEELSGQAQMLKSYVSRFQLKQGSSQMVNQTVAASSSEDEWLESYAPSNDVKY